MRNSSNTLILSLSLFFTLFCSVASFAQIPPEIYGRVTDYDGNPISGASVTVKQSGMGVITDYNGNYRIVVEAGKLYTVQFSHTSYFPDEESTYLRSGDVREINKQLDRKDYVLPSFTTTARTKRRATTIQKIDKVAIETLPNPSGGMEMILRTMPGVTGNNELSSQYSVRGGNFDENLVYVNDFEIYRPFLIRSGQQEGLSFVNPDLVSSIGFSAGGFEAKYGDKLSSVLDVKYKKPKEFAGSVGVSLMGATAHLEGKVKSRRNVTYLLGARYRNNQYLLNALPTDGQFRPTFADMQGFFTFQLAQNWEWQVLGHYSRNSFSFIPQESVSSFGSFNESLQLTVFFDGQETDSYETGTAGTALVFTPNNNLTLKLLGSGYTTRETEAFDIIGQYWLEEVENNLGDDNFGQAVRRLGVGTYQDWARNRLQANIFNVAHRGYLQANRHFLSWGGKFQHEEISDELNEWYRLDSAGYSIPYSGVDVAITDVLKTSAALNSNRYTAFLQDEWTLGAENQVSITYGIRGNYWDLNEEFIYSPRAQFAWFPKLKQDTIALAKQVAELPADVDEKTKNRLEGKLLNRKTRELTLRLSGGLYQQPAFYRELRGLDGLLNTNLSAQKSGHIVLGAEYSFNIWQRPFKLTAEAYYKHLWDLVPFNIENVLIRYFGDNMATGYSTGLDLRLNGEFVKGTESWISLSYLRARENLADDHYYDYYNEAGELIVSGITPDQIPVDSTRVDVGSVARPTESPVSFGMFFQDYLPNNENFKVHLMMLFALGNPYTPSDAPQLRSAARIPPYRRLDIGFSAQLFDRDKKELAERSPLRGFKSIWASLEVFNLLGISNTISYNYIKALSGDLRQERIYNVPNYLTSRRVNLRFQFKF